MNLNEFCVNPVRRLQQKKIDNSIEYFVSQFRLLLVNFNAIERM